MGKIQSEKLIKFIEPSIGEYHEKILTNLLGLKLSAILKRKNPYLFRAKAIDTAQDLVKCILDAHLSSQEEGIFGGFLEELAIFICGEVYGVHESSGEGIDLEFDIGKTRNIVSIKSGPNWGNSQQISRMKDNFRKAKRILRTHNRQMTIVAVNGCCYGKDDQPDKGDYFKYCGQRFWEFISGNANLYVEIIEPLGYRAKQRNQLFKKEYAKVINRFTLEFAQEYCKPDGEIDWEKLVKFNSGKKT